MGIHTDIKELEDRSTELTARLLLLEGKFNRNNKDLWAYIIDLEKTLKGVIRADQIAIGEISAEIRGGRFK